MRLKYFRGCNSLQELKKEYKKLLKINHPDNGGDLVTMQEINAEYAKLEKVLPDIELDESQTEETRETRQNYTSADISPVLQAVMNRLSTIPGIEVEICGSNRSGNMRFLDMGFRKYISNQTNTKRDRIEILWKEKNVVF